MTELLTAAQMRAIEHAAIESGQVTGLELMERAGQGVVEAIFEEWPEFKLAPQTAAVLCGPGNNGGDGFVVARLLKGQGWDVKVLFYGNPEKLPPDAKVNYEIWTADDQVHALTEGTLRELHCSLYIDALFGTGLTRPIEGEAWNVLTHMSGRNGDNYIPYTVAIDSPSGLCMDSGRVLGMADTEDHDYRGKAAAASLTVAFDSPKIGHFIGIGPSLCGKLIIKDIGLADWRATMPLPGREDIPMKRGGVGRALRPAKVTLVGPDPLVEDPRMRLQGWSGRMLDKARIASHKYTHGHALVLSGGESKTGAARLAARGALRVGAGLVTLGAPKLALFEVASQITAIMLEQIDDTDALGDVLEDERLNALCLGPGLGLDRARQLVPVALSSGRPTVLDADGLSAFADEPGLLFEALHDRCILTPHRGEFARLFPDIAERLAAPKRPMGEKYTEYDPSNIAQRMEDLQRWRDELAVQSGPAYSKVDATCEAAKRAGCVVLFKGPDTVIAAPNGQCSVNSAHYERAAPWLATAGSGDVLAGFITGLLARGFQPMKAAETAAWLHVECARQFGPGLIAEDLPEQLPKVLKKLNI